MHEGLVGWVSAQDQVFSTRKIFARGGRFNFSLTPMGGWVGVKYEIVIFFLLTGGVSSSKRCCRRLEEYSENVGYLKEQQHPHSNVVDDFNNEQ